MNTRLPAFFDPCKVSDAIPAIDVYCDRCGMLGVRADWRIVHVSVRAGYRKQCPNCQDTRVKDLREGGNV